MHLDAHTETLAGQVIYQIFPERFAIGGGLTSGQKLASTAYDLPGARRCAWDGELPPGSNTFCGGDLPGVAEKLDYLQDLGVTTVYLTPVFRSPSNHKYDAVDLLEVDPMFGGAPALEGLLADLHGRGMKLMLDAVLNHVSARHPWYLAARAGDPEYRDFFAFGADGQCPGWQDHASMPELDLANPRVRDRLYRDPASPVQHWLARGIDGWRFDTAQDLGLAVAAELALSVGARFPMAWLVGEVCGYGAAWASARPGFHGVMNYHLRTALLSWLRGEISTPHLHAALGDLREGYGLRGLLGSWNLLSNHDAPRLASVLGDPAKVRLAFLAQMTLPGVPVIYYGDEVGLEGGADPDNRRPMPWDEARWDRGLRAWVKALVAVRQASPALRHGDIRLLGDRLEGDALVFLRHTDQPGEAALVVVNRSGRPLRAKLLVPWSHWYDSVPLRDALGGAPDTRVEMGAVWLEVAPWSGAVYQAFEPFERYRFFKRRNRAGFGPD
jgi:alpha-glucosidase